MSVIWQSHDTEKPINGGRILNLEIPAYDRVSEMLNRALSVAMLLEDMARFAEQFRMDYLGVLTRQKAKAIVVAVIKIRA